MQQQNANLKQSLPNVLIFNHKPYKSTTTMEILQRNCALYNAFIPKSTFQSSHQPLQMLLVHIAHEKKHMTSILSRIMVTKMISSYNIY